MLRFEVLCLLCLFLSLCKGAYVCQYYDRTRLTPTCAVYNPSSYAYYDPDEQTIDELITYTNNFINGIAGFGPIPPCGAYLQTWFCQNPSITPPIQNPLRNCPVNNLFEPPATPVQAPVCWDLCERFRTSCLPIFEGTSQSLADILKPSFCDSYTNDGLTIDGYHYPCWNVTPTLNLSEAIRDCPDYLANNTGGCGPACPSPEYTHDQVFNIGLMQQIVGWISFFTALIMGIVFLCFEQLRTFPSRLVLFLVVSSMILSLAFMLATFVGGNVGDVWCGDVTVYNLTLLDGSTTRIVNNQDLCAFEGWNIVLGTLLLAHWWAALAVNTSLLVRSCLRMEVPAYNWKLECSYHCVCWGLPLIYSVIAAAASKLAYEPQNTFCFIASDNNNAWQIALWFVPMGYCLLIGLVCSLYSVCIIGKLYFTGHTHKQFLGAIFRIVLCLLFFFTVITLIFASQIYASQQQDSTSFAIIRYMVCKVAGQSENTCREGLNSVSPVHTIYELWFATTFFMSATGVFLVVFFGTAHNVVSELRSTRTSSHRSSGHSHHSSPQESSVARATI